MSDPSKAFTPPTRERTAVGSRKHEQWPDDYAGLLGLAVELTTGLKAIPHDAAFISQLQGYDMLEHRVRELQKAQHEAEGLRVALLEDLVKLLKVHRDGHRVSDTDVGGRRRG